MKKLVLLGALLVLTCGAVEKDEAWLLQTNLLAKGAAKTEARLPNVLILGDSISLGYTPLEAVEAILSSRPLLDWF